jgi:hypothetical protein
MQDLPGNGPTWDDQCHTALAEPDPGGRMRGVGKP